MAGWCRAISSRHARKCSDLGWTPQLSAAQCVLEGPVLEIGASLTHTAWQRLANLPADTVHDRLIPAAAILSPEQLARLENAAEACRAGQITPEDLCAAMGGAELIEAYGKAAVVGVDGEIEHASAVIHTLRFGNHFREAVNASSYLAFTNKRGGPGTSIQVPMMHKDDEGMRSHYLTLEMRIDDAPRADEIIVVLGAADGGRPHARIGSRYTDKAEMDAEGC